MNNTNRKQSNLHKAHPTNCERCGRQLPKRHYHPTCSACIKQVRDFNNMLTQEVERSEFLNQVFKALTDAGAKEIA